VKKILLFIIFFSLSAIQNFYAQDIKIGPGIGATFLGGEDLYTKEISDGGLGLDKGLSYGGKLKIGVPLTPLSFALNVFYTEFSMKEHSKKIYLIQM